MAKRKWEYMGDVSIQHGGYFWCDDTAEDDYVDAVRVTPCSSAGGPDNMFWVESYTVILPRDIETLRSVLSTSGWEPDAGEYADATPAAKLGMLVDACISYGKYDQEFSECVRIGRADPFFNFQGRGWDNHPIDTQLRAGSSLRNYVLDKFIPMHK